MTVLVSAEMNVCLLRPQMGPVHVGTMLAKYVADRDAVTVCVTAEISVSILRLQMEIVTARERRPNCAVKPVYSRLFARKI